MKRFLSKLLGRPISQTSPRRGSSRRRPSLEALEDRTLMAVFINSAGNLEITGSNGQDHVAVNRVVDLFDMVHVTHNNVTHSYFTYQVTGGRVLFRGYGGNDFFTNNVPGLRTQAWGGDGNDTLWGDAGQDSLYGENHNDVLHGYTGNDYVSGGLGNDTLYGESGDDTLYAGGGDDKLYGASGYDRLYGEAGRDFLDDGSGTELNSGGVDYDFNAYVTAVGGATYTDVRQGGSPTCWLVASIASVARTGVNLANRITYLGNNVYRVGLYNHVFAGIYQYVYQNVTFDGSILGADATPNPNQEGESWVLLTQRAYLLWHDISLTNPPGGSPVPALAALTGQNSDDYNIGPEWLDRVLISSMLSQGHNVVACTWGEQWQVPSTHLVAWHCYTVMGLSYNSATSQYEVTLRNPWGVDGGSSTSGDPNDGLIVVSWNMFRASMSGYAVN